MFIILPLIGFIGMFFVVESIGSAMGAAWILFLVASISMGLPIPKFINHEKIDQYLNENHDEEIIIKNQCTRSGSNKYEEWKFKLKKFLVENPKIKNYTEGIIRSQDSDKFLIDIKDTLLKSLLWYVFPYLMSIAIVLVRNRTIQSTYSLEDSSYYLLEAVIAMGPPTYRIAFIIANILMIKKVNDLHIVNSKKLLEND